MIIDFVGIPGCGKSFLAHELEIKMRKDNYRVYNMSREKITPLKLKIIFKISEKLILLLPSYRKAKHQIECKLSDYLLSQSLYFKNDLSRILDNILTHTFIHRNFQSGPAIYLNDEGILHKLLYLYVHYDVPITSITEVYSLLQCNVKNVIIHNEVENSLFYIRSRNRHDCIMDDLDDTSLVMYLEKFYSAIAAVNLSGYIYIDRNENISKNIELIYQAVEKQG